MKKFIILKHRKTQKESEANPPLPIEPQIKTEKLTQTDNLQQEIEVTNGPKETCRDFLRGHCEREGFCKFAHQPTVDKDELDKMYTFCHDFQNSQCKFKNCKYVHATISEKMAIYRTGVLPPHVLARYLPQPIPLSPPPRVQPVLPPLPPSVQPVLPTPPPPPPPPVLPPPPPPPAQPKVEPQVPPPPYGYSVGKRPRIDTPPCQPQVPPPAPNGYSDGKRPRMDTPPFGSGTRDRDRMREEQESFQIELNQFVKTMQGVLWQGDLLTKIIMTVETLARVAEARLREDINDLCERDILWAAAFND